LSAGDYVIEREDYRGKYLQRVRCHKRLTKQVLPTKNRCQFAPTIERSFGRITMALYKMNTKCQKKAIRIDGH